MRASVLVCALALACCVLLSASLCDARPSPPNHSGLSYTPAALKDQITSLPGLDVQAEFNMFSGYLQVDSTTQKSIFYWYIESSNAPATDPLIWWSNGGPGCSGLLGLLTEHGPFRPQRAPKTGLDRFDYSWNTMANVLYVEAPAGVGFSYSANPAKDYTTGDAQTAKDNLKAIHEFFVRFPHLTKNNFFLSSESYGGHYLPTLADVLVNEGSITNFRGFLLGNPLTDMVENTNGMASTLCGHSLASRPTCDTYAARCLGAGLNLANDSKAWSWCENAQNAVSDEAGALDLYGLLYPTCSESAQARTLLKQIYHERKQSPSFPKKLRAQLDKMAEPQYDPCGMDEQTLYLNRKDVRAALHVHPSVGEWEPCTDNVRYNNSDVNTPMQPLYASLLKRKVPMVIFSGDDDAVCATLGTQMWMYDMLPVTKAWGTWMYQSEEYGQQIGGYTVGFEGITLVTVHGAGHMVSGYQPERGLAVLDNFLKGKFFNLKEEQQQLQQEKAEAYVAEE